MVLQVTLRDKRGIAYVTREGPLAGVRAHMSLQVTYFIKLLQARGEGADQVPWVVLGLLNLLYRNYRKSF